MNARAHHLRFISLCAAILLALGAIAWADENTNPLLWELLFSAPLAFAGTFVLCHFQRSREGNFDRRKTLGEVPTQDERQLATVVYLVFLSLGVTIVAIAALAPEYLARANWVVPVLAGAAGIHARAIM
ncbi:hypothetical protein RQP53_16370 [Paucibacter sp. APW11]|uniref:DUF2178 domain-containing protein n=1 Tax=Roseateles aquae TaxID=3077235 RepID=A0ABU3PEX0_9BURK|nr:hypothetical protein [Paucibacter sp. APW11]MDT9000852.1 hypothetical protein [Paucibacter sp. APW11]